MISHDRDYEDILRDALRAAAESVEPAVDGLERIRHRSHSRRSAGSTLARAAEWLRLYRIRLSVRLESLRWELTEEASQQLPGAMSWLGRAVVLARRVAAWLQPPAKPGHGGRERGGKSAGLGPAAAWLRPALAVGAVVVVVVGGVIALNHGVVATISPANNAMNSPRQHHHASGVVGLATPNSQQSPLAPQPSPSASGVAGQNNATTSPTATCPPTPKSAQSSKPAPSRTPTPTPSSSGSGTPTPSPSGSGGPSPTPSTGSGSSGPGTAGTSTVQASTMSFVTSDRTGDAAPVTCGSKQATTPASKAPTTKASATTS